MPTSSRRTPRTRTALRLGALLATTIVAGCASAPHRPSLPPAPSEAEIAKIPDSIPRPEPRSARGNPPFYDVFGKRYFVMSDAAGYVEQGVASWYGPGFHQGTTSNGERYDMYAMTAAHRTLPLPAYVQVTNLRNGRSVVVRVNDRGPFKDDRIIDMSYSAAAKLDMIREGTTFVEVRALTPAPGSTDPERTAASPANVQSTAAAASSIYVQAGAFSSAGNAENLLQRLRADGVEKGFVKEDRVEGRTLYRVRVGPVPNVAEFDRVVARLKSLGVPDARLAAE